MIAAASRRGGAFEGSNPSLLLLGWKLRKMFDRKVCELLDEFFLADALFCLCHRATPYITQDNISTGIPKQTGKPFDQEVNPFFCYDVVRN